MRALLLVLAVAACHIPEEHFVKPGGGGDGGGDGKQADARPDSPANGPSNAYALDPQMGIFQLTRDRATGTLAIVSSTPTPAPASLDSVTDPSGSHIYVIGADSTNPHIQAFAIASNGSLTPGNSVPFAHCYPQIASIDPTGKWIAVGCSTAYVAVVPITANGELGTPFELGGGVNPQAAAWSTDGKCVFFADSGASGTLPNVIAFVFDPTQGSLAAAGGAVGPPVSAAVAVSPMGNTLFVAGRGTPNGTVQEYQYTPSCGLQAQFSPVSIGTNAQLALVDPLGTTLYVTDNGLWAFSIAANGLVPYANNPHFAATGITFGIAIHPVLPKVVYVTGYAYQGTIVVTNDGNGGLSQAASLSPSASTIFLQLEP